MRSHIGIFSSRNKEEVGTNVFFFSKKKYEFLGDIKSFHSAKFRFTFTHVYT